jgi:geranylgeranyl reductase family protein
MNATHHAELLVVGLGPAGASAARVAAELGVQVLAVERREVIGLPVQCAEYIPLTIARHARGSGIRQQAVGSMKSWLDRSESVQTEVPGLMIDRGRFDQSLAEAAQRAGAELATATRLLGLDPENRRATLSRRGREYRVSYDYLVAADGPRSRVARALGLPGLEAIYGYQYRLPLLRPMPHTEVWHDGRFPGGYAWLFPRGGEVNLGVGGDGDQVARLRSGLEALRGELVRAGRVGERVLSATGGPIPVAGLRAPLVVGRHLFVGDAAGFCHPITGAGIASAVDSGCAAGEAIARHRLAGEEQALQEYQTEMRERYGASLRHAVERRRWLREQWQAGRYDTNTLRRGWIACPEYFERSAQVDAP